MHFAFGQIEHCFGLALQVGIIELVNGHKELLTDKIADEMLLCRIDGIGLPHEPHLLKKRVKHTDAGVLKTHLQVAVGKYLLKLPAVKVHHGHHKTVYLCFVTGVGLSYFRKRKVDICSIQLGDLGDLEPMIVEHRDIEQLLQLFVRVCADVGVGTLRIYQSVAFLPDSNGVRLYA